MRYSPPCPSHGRACVLIVDEEAGTTEHTPALKIGGPIFDARPRRRPNWAKPLSVMAFLIALATAVAELLR